MHGFSSRQPATGAVGVQFWCCDLNEVQSQGFSFLSCQATLRVHVGKRPGWAQYEIDPCVGARVQKFVCQEYDLCFIYV